MSPARGGRALAGDYFDGWSQNLYSLTANKFIEVYVAILELDVPVSATVPRCRCRHDRVAVQ